MNQLTRQYYITKYISILKSSALKVPGAHSEDGDKRVTDKEMNGTVK